jgi:beta-lactamase regulating signal transducer with metallopeptidase domain
MTHLIDATINNGPALFAGVTLLLTFGCLAVAAHRSPVHRQRLAELAISATLIWVILAVTPLPRPLAHGFFAELSASMRPRSPAPEAPPAPQPESSSEPSSAPDGPQIQLDLTPALLAQADEDGVVMDDESLSDSLILKDDAINPKSAAWTFSPSVRAAVNQSVDRTVVINSARADGQPVAQTETPGEAVSPSLSARVATYLRANWKLLLVGAYALGVALCVAWIALGRGLLAMIVWTSEWPETWLEDMFAELCDECDTLRVWLVVSKRYPRAMSFGIFRPTIVLPAAQCVPENAELLRHVLRHELVHIGRRDAWGTLLFNVSFLFLFFHPAFWWLRSRARLSAELVADEWAATRSSRDEYARELIAFVRATRRKSFLPAGATGVLGSTTPFSRRIEMLIRRERPLVMRSSPAWRIASCTVLGGLIIAMAASLGRTAQDEPEKPGKTPAVSETATVTVTVDDEDDKPAVNLSTSATVVADDDEDNVIIKLKDDDEDDDAPKSGDKRLARMKMRYAKLARESERLHKQMAELQQALAESKATQANKSATAGEKKQGKAIVKGNRAFAFSDSEHGPTTIILDDGKLIINGKKIDLENLKGLESLKELDGLKGVENLKGLEGLDSTIRDAVKDALKFKVKIIEDEEDSHEKGGKGSAHSKVETDKKVIIKKKQLDKEKHGKTEERSSIHLKTDDGEIELEIGADHALKVKKLKGFGKDQAELDGMKKSLEKLGAKIPNVEGLKVLGELKGLEELKGLGELNLGELKELKELGHLKELARLKDLGNLKILIETDDEVSHGSGHGHGVGSGHGEKQSAKKHKAEIKSDKEETEEQGFKFAVPPGAFDMIQGQAHRAQMEAHRAQMQALRAQIEAQRQLLEKLQQKAERMRKESSTSKDSAPSASNPAPKAETTQRHTVVKADPAHAATRRQTERAVHELVLRELKKNSPLTSSSKSEDKHLWLLDQSAAKKLGTADKYALSGNAAVHEKAPEGTAVQEKVRGAAASLNAPTDVMHLAELVSNAIGEFDQAKSELEANAPPDLMSRIATKSRMLTAERKVRLLGKIAKSLHTLASAQAKRGNEHDQDEANAKLQILELIISDVNTALGKSETSVSPMNSSVPAAPVAPMATVTSVAPVASVAAVTSVAPVAKSAVPVATASPAAVVTPTAPAAATPASAKSTKK